MTQSKMRTTLFLVMMLETFSRVFKPNSLLARVIVSTRSS
jgi:hypothetical protein